jgi:MerR family transcriptional regulator, light-induced transcriptional regulator
MTSVRTNAAAVMLGVSPNTLRSWERRFGYPMPRRTSGGHRQYDLGELEALRQAFEETQNISSAVSIARERGEGPASATRLASAFKRFDESKVNRMLEESLSLRSVERTVSELLLPAVESLDGEGSEHQFAWRTAAGWLAAASRVAPPAHRRDGVLLCDASALYDDDALHVQALDLVLRRAGLRTLTLSPSLASARMASALRALRPRAIVLAGSGSTLDALGRVVYAARQQEGEVSVFDYRGALPDTGASTVRRLGDTPLQARDALIAVLDGVPQAGDAVPGIDVADLERLSS